MDSTESAREAQKTALRVIWDAADNIPVMAANQFAVTLGLPAASGRPDGIYLLVGHLAPPTIVGAADEIRQYAEASGGKIAVSVHGRYLLSRDRLQELIDTLTSMAEQYDQAVDRSTAGEAQR
ncbi:hypothetical protein AB0B62_15670 [Micromonospora chalcea]|uniref:hypothetical protein n=1 Tax=Micromonospora chalcea TaxID=1874 RepID=UPI0033CA1F15